jgi:pilus assembly protein CpaC
MKAGQTLAIAGLVYSREESVNRGIPVLADLPYFGAPFRRVSNRRNEVELLIFVTPEFCDALDPNEVPPCGPGQLTTTPTDCELYMQGYLEVPKGDCLNGNCAPGQTGPLGPMYEEIPTPQFNQGAANRGKSGTSRLAPIVSAPRPSTSPTAMTVSTAPTRTASAGVTPQNRDNAYYSGGTVQKPTAGQQPSLIGPVGYDDLK